MTDKSKNIFRENIKELMKVKDINQKQLAEIINMPQPNISKALKADSGKFFTIDHIYDLAEYFDKSIDTLFGRNQHDEYSEKDICSLIVSVIEKRQAVFSETVRQERHANGNPYGPGEWKEDFTYSALLFPVVFDPGPLDQYDEIDLDNLQDAFISGCHEMSNNQRINNFIKKFRKLYDMYIHHDMDEEDYRHLINKYLDELH